MIALSSGWTSAPEKHGAELWDPLLRALSRLPFAALALDAGVSARALDDVRPAIARGDFSVALLRGPVGMPPPETEHRRPYPRLCAPDAAERDAAVAAHARTLELASDLEIRLSTVSLGA